MFPERQYQNGLFVCLEIWCRVSQNTTLQKTVRVFFNCQYFFIFKRISMIQNNSFLWKMYKNQLFQNQWIKTKYTLLFLLLFTTGQRGKRIKKKKTLFVSAGTQKRWKTAGSGKTLPQYLPNPKSKFPLKFIFT